MADCDLTAGRKKVCKSGIGGNSILYLFNFLEDPFTVVAGAATAMNVLLTEAFAYPLEGDLNTLSEDVVTDRNTGTTINTQTTTAVLKQIDVLASAQMMLLAKGYPMAVVKDRMNNYHLIGADEGIDFNVNAQTGGVMNDLNGYTLVGTSTTSEIGALLDSATVTAFLAVVAVNP